MPQTRLGMLIPRIQIQKFSDKNIKNRIVNTIKVGAMIEGYLGQAGVSITGKVVEAMHKQIETKRKRIAEQHQTDLEDWRLTKGRNLIETLRQSVEVRKEIKQGRVRYRFLLGRESFMREHAPYWRMLDRGGKISLDAIGVPGYFGKGLLPSAIKGAKIAKGQKVSGGKYGLGESFHYTGATSLGKASPKVTAIGLMIPKRLIKGINYIGAGMKEFNKQAQIGFNIIYNRTHKLAKRAIEGQEIKVDPVLNAKELLNVIKRSWKDYY